MLDIVIHSFEKIDDTFRICKLTKDGNWYNGYNLVSNTELHHDISFTQSAVDNCIENYPECIYKFYDTLEELMENHFVDIL